MLTCTSCGTAVALPEDPRALSAACKKCGTSVDLSSMRTIADPVTPAAGAAQDELLKSGHLLSGYRVEQLLGRGGMAVVYKGTQLSLNRSVAIKALPRHLASNPAFVARFNREAGALAALSHPNIIQIIDRGVEKETYYFVMEFVDGPDLRGLLDRQRPVPAETARIISSVCAALEYAHKRGVIHRDVKPGNVMIDREGTVKVTDFGIAHLAGGGQDTGLMLTMAGAQMGTVNYMAPEQRMNARDVDARADIYAVGVMLYEMLTGQLPFGAFEPPSQLASGVDRKFDAIVTKALKQDPKARYAAAKEMAAALAALAADAPAEPVEAGPAKTVEPVKPGTTYPCPGCKSENAADAKFCLSCGKTLLESCPKCKRSIRVGSKFCDGCGVNVADYLTRHKEALELRVTTADKMVKEGKFAEAIGELTAITTAEGSELEELREKAKAKLEKVRKQKEDLDAAFRKGQERYDKKDFEKAIDEWTALPKGLVYVQDAISEARKKIEARAQAVRAAETAHSAERFEEALKEWQRVTELSMDTAPFQARIDEARARAGEIHFRQLMKRGTDCATARDFAGAIAAWTEALKWKPGDATAQAWIKSAEGQKRLADRDALVARADQAIAGGRSKEAVDLLQKALPLVEPENAALKSSLEQKLQSARADHSKKTQKMIVVGAIVGGGFLLVAAVVIVLVLVLGGSGDKKSSPSSSSGGTTTGGGGTRPTRVETPEEIFDRCMDFVIQGNSDAAYQLHSSRYRTVATQAQMEEVYRVYLNPRYLRQNRRPAVIMGEQASIVCRGSWSDGQYNYNQVIYVLAKEQGNWRIEGLQGGW